MLNRERRTFLASCRWALPVRELRPDSGRRDVRNGQMEKKASRADSPLVVFVVICLITLPEFFDIYRNLAFNTVPHDDYAPFLLCFTSQKGIWPGSPFGYRLLSVLPAVPLYWILPLYKFGRLNVRDLSYLKALEALAGLSFISIAGSATIAFSMVLRKLGRSEIEAALAATLTIILSKFLPFPGVDEFAILILFALLYFLERPAIFCPAFVFVPFINEKILLFFVFLTIARSVFVRDFFSSHTWQTASVIAGLIIYVATLKIIHLPGNENQTVIGYWIPQLVRGTTVAFSSLKGTVLNILPLVLFVTPCLLFSLRAKDSTELLMASDFLVPLGLLTVALATTGTFDFQLGRIVAYALPLTVISSILLFAARGDKAFSSVTEPQTIRSMEGISLP